MVPSNRARTRMAPSKRYKVVKVGAEYQVYDSITETTMATYSTAGEARRRRNRLNGAQR